MARDVLRHSQGTTKGQGHSKKNPAKFQRDPLCDAGGTSQKNQAHTQLLPNHELYFFMHQELIYGESKPNTLPDNGSGYNCKHTHPAIHKGTGLHNPQTVPPATLHLITIITTWELHGFCVSTNAHAVVIKQYYF